MQRVSQAIEQHPAELTENEVAESVSATAESTLTAIGWFQHEGYIVTAEGQSGRDVYESVKPYREKDDPESNRYVNAGSASRPD